MTPKDMSVPAFEMNALRPLINQPPSCRSALGADATGVRSGVRLRQSEGAERTTFGQWTQPALALLVVAEQEQRHRSDRHVRLEGGGDRLVGVAELLERGHEAHSRHPDSAPLLRDEHAEQSELTHLPQQIGRALGSLPRGRGPPGDLLRRELTTEVDEIAFGLVQREVHVRP